MTFPPILRTRIAAGCGLLVLLSACTVAPGASLDPSGASPSVAPTSAPPSERPQPTTSAAPPSADPTSAPSATEMTATFAEEGNGRTAVDDVVAFEGGFVAIGHAWPGEFVAEQPLPRLWVSADGTSWEARPMELGVERATLSGLVIRDDGQLLVAGRSADAATIGPEEATPAAWISSDAEAWEPIDLPVPEPVTSIDQGARGYALTAGGELWFSTDAVDWTMTASGADAVRAGDEGFVAIQVEDGSARTGAVIASADGEEWIESPTFATGWLQVAAFGSDWLATGFLPGETGEIGVWRSANGLEWTQVLDVNELTPEDGPKTGRGLKYDSISGATLATVGTRAFLTLTNNHCCAQLPWTFGVWTSADGETWDVVIEDDALVGTAAAIDDGTVVMAGHLRRGEEAAFWRLGDED